MKIFTYFAKDSKIFLKSKSSVLLTFLVPMILIFIFGSIFSNMGKQKGINAINVLTVDYDDSQFSQAFLNELDKLTEIKIVREVKVREEVQLITEESMHDFIKKGNFGLGIVIDKGFENNALKGDSLSLTLNYDPMFAIEYGILSGMIQKTVFSKFPQLMFKGFFRLSENALGNEQNKRFQNSVQNTVKQYFPDAEFDFSTDNLTNMTFSDTSSTNEGDTFLKEMININSVQVTGAEIKNPMFSQSVAGMAVMFLLFSVNAVAGSLLAEKKDGSLKRILISPIKPVEIILGKMSFCIVLGIIQLTLMFVFGYFVFELDIFRDVLSLISVIIATSLACTSIGIFLATICKTERQADSLSTLIVLSMSALGGSFVPSFIMPASIKTIGRFTLNHWSMKGFTDIFWRQLGFSEILVSVAVLTGIFILFSSLALFLFKRRFLEQQ